MSSLGTFMDAYLHKIVITISVLAIVFAILHAVRGGNHELTCDEMRNWPMKDVPARCFVYFQKAPNPDLK